MVENYPIKSTNIISHIRIASEGCVSIANTHPFVRELWGEYWVFAHNGHIDIEAADIIKEWEEPFYSPVGDTDSETLFCDLLNALRSTFSAPPSSKILFNVVTQWAKRVRAAGICNFLLSNGKWQIAHANTLLYYLIRQAPFGEATLIDEDFTIDFATVTTPNDRVAVIATLPLTRNEIWQPFAVNEAIMFAQGEVLHRDQPEGAHYLTREEGLAIAAKMGVAGDY